MAERRMFAKTIVLSDAFLDMPLSARCLYFTFGMLADDDGFVNSPKSIMRQCGASDDDLKVLISKKFVIVFDSGIIVIKHWRINNYLRNDRYKETVYHDEKSNLIVDERGIYHSGIPSNGIPSIGKDSIGKDSIGNNVSNSNELDKSHFQSDDAPKTVHQDILKAWNDLQQYGIRPIRSINPGTKRSKLLTARIREYGKDSILEAIEIIKDSDFLQGKTGKYGKHKNWTFDFDWFISPNNFPKVLEGKYKNQNQGNENDWGV